MIREELFRKCPHCNKYLRPIKRVKYSKKEKKIIEWMVGVIIDGRKRFNFNIMGFAKAMKHLFNDRTIGSILSTIDNELYRKGYRTS